MVPTVCNQSFSTETSTDLTIVSVASSTSVGKAVIRPATVTTPFPEILPGAEIFGDEGSGDDQIINTNSTKVVFLSDSSEYVPVPALRSRSPAVIPAGSDTASSNDLEWRIPIESWDREYRRFRSNNTRVQHIEAECQDEYMKIRVGFNGSFTGLVYSAGYAYDPECMYINGSGRDYYEFYIQLNRCGTLGKNTRHDDPRKSPTKNFMWNTVTVQYNPLIEEEFDEHFKVTCEYGYDFWKTVTFPFLDVEVATGNPVVFTLQPPECYMEIRNGYGTNGARVSGPVRVGDPLTLIIYMRSKYDGFDIVVNDCFAHNGGTKKIQLIDEYGCPVDDKLISRFRGSWSESGVFETQVFAYMKTFRFTGSPALYIECDVRMCHGRCPTQPCHWRNVKNHRKRDVEAESTSIGPNSLSENINLFQSLRVLQEGEDDDDYSRNYTKINDIT
ncbi:cuticlin-6 [Arctopsyche grandis]|uniref:cuticlin-6 n=1 Tax=Arctopsyche grandis TaxID=121162 RepID=UPI00406D994F